MCGKSVRRVVDIIANRAGAIPSAEDPKYSDFIPGNKAAIIQSKGEVTVDRIWGYNIMDKLVYNARSETWKEKVSFKDSKPCLVPVDGFYENNQLFVSTSHEPLYMAGLHKDGRFVVLTQDATKLQVGKYYHRAPILLGGAMPTGKWLISSILPDLNKTHERLNHESLYKPKD